MLVSVGSQSLSDMCCLTQQVWRNCVAPQYSCSRKFYTLRSVVSRHSQLDVLTGQPAKQVWSIACPVTQQAISTLQCCNSLLTTKDKVSQFSQQNCFSTSRFSTRIPYLLTNVCCCHKENFDGYLTQNYRHPQHYNYRPLSLSTKAIVDASPLSLQPYLKLIRLDRPIGNWLLFLPCAWSISLAAPAGHLPNASMLALFALGSCSMRAAACTINDMWDKDYDMQVLRTCDRPLASGQISQFRALTFLALPLSVSLGILLSFNWNTVMLGAVSMIPCIIYPLMKRVTYWPQAFLGITLNWGVMISWSALHGCLTLPGFVLYSSCVLWTMIYDTIYSHQDKDDDIQIGVKSTALKFGDQTKLWLAAFASGVSGGLALTGAMCDQPWLYFAGVGIVTAYLANQIYFVNLNDPASCATVFRSNRNLGLIFWAFIVGAGLLTQSEM